MIGNDPQIEDLERRLGRLERERDHTFWTSSQYLREERLPSLAGDLVSDGGSSFISVARILGLTINNITLANGANNDIDIGTATFVRITGPTGAFSVSGFQGAADGRLLILLNTTSQQMTITHNAGSAAGSRISTLQSGDLVMRAGNSLALFIYSTDFNFWVLAAANGDLGVL